MRSHRKKQNYFLIVMIALSVAICIVHNWKPGRHVGEYTFWRAESMKDLEAMAGTSHVYGPPQVSLETDARFRGALLALFGEPLWESEDYEAAYEYLIRAVDEEGREYLLTAYQGPSGAAIAGDTQTEGIEEAAESLCELLLESEPADFEAEMVYMDLGIRVSYGCRDGKPYVRETKEELRL